MEKRSVVMTIEVVTDMTIEELSTLRALTFGTLRQSRDGVGPKRWTIKREVPQSNYQDCRGTIKQIQSNVVKDAGAAKPKRKKVVASSEGE